MPHGTLGSKVQVGDKFKIYNRDFQRDELRTVISIRRSKLPTWLCELLYDTYRSGDLIITYDNNQIEICYSNYSWI